MAKFVQDDAVKASIDAQRQAYYRDLAEGRETLPEHDFSDKDNVNLPTKMQKQRIAIAAAKAAEEVGVQFKSEGGMVRGLPPAGSQSQGSIVEADVDPKAPEPETEPVEMTDEEKAAADAEEQDAQARAMHTIPIPDNYKEEVKWTELRKLAQRFYTGPVTNIAHAHAIIDAELETREEIAAEEKAASKG